MTIDISRWRVGGVVDREGRAQAHLVGLAAQDAHAGAVEGHHPHRLGARADERRHPLAHLGGGLVGEGDGEHLAGLHAHGPPSRWAMRWVSTRVLPEPAPATMSSGPPSCSTASRCCGLSPTSSCSGSAPGARRGRPAVGAQPGGGGLGPGGHTGRVDQRRVGAGVGGGVHVRLVAAVRRSRGRRRGCSCRGQPYVRATDPALARRAPGHRRGGRDHHRGPGRPWRRCSGVSEPRRRSVLLRRGQLHQG